MNSTTMRIFTLALLLAVSTVQAADLQLRAKCRPAGPVVTVDDVAEVAAADPKQADALREVELFAAPIGGQPRVLRVRELQDLLLARRVNLAEHRLSGASEIVVLSDETPEQPALKRSPSPVQEDGVVVATAAIAKGTAIRDSDVRLEPPANPRARSAGCGSLDEVVGKEAACTIPAGVVVETGMLREALLVRRGEVVTVAARSGGIRVRTTAQAQQDGGLGQTIQLVSLLSNQKMLARVTGPREAEVELLSASRPARGASSETRPTFER